ncbi:MAG: Rpn family recombination-promoting nuclease/putative transposase, partial [Lachnospiraceae bacterium]|nr:Rpn family recombination-promoting nuclease/putative transposase [Lachnospiraceae bacterium]
MRKSESVAATPILSDALQGASGPVTIPMTNDYLFRALLQSNNRVLKGLICSLLHMAPKQIKSVTITNPIELGKAIDAKTLILDVKVLMNNDTTINLEMQVINEHNWPERSLTYLCRSFDSLNTGEAYLSVKPVIQISLLDFTLFPENPEFYATYRFLNEKNHMIYSDKLRISVLDLTRIDLATEEDRMYGIDHWAALFKSGTWE